jgi:hypothetical protein
MTSEIQARENLRALCSTSQATSSFANRLQVAMVKIANFGAVRKAHAIPKPVEAIGQDDLALGANRETVYFGGE